jgi:ubiquinone/menaquinone biosynthesis C-methylase UbiE
MFLFYGIDGNPSPPRDPRPARNLATQPASCRNGDEKFCWNGRLSHRIARGTVQMERVEAEEMLDCDGWSQEQVTCALGAIRRVNLFYGGDRMHKRLFRRVVTRLRLESVDILEVASARGEVVRGVASMLRKKNICVRVSLLDRSDQHLPVPGDWPTELTAPTLLVGDALAIPLPDSSVDVVSCCLFLHHLSAEQARAFLREALRVCRVAVLVNDVERSRTNYFCSLMYRLIDPSELSRHDGPTSVRQAYTHKEVEGLLRETGCRFELQRGYLFRLGAIAWKDGVPVG